MPCLPPTRAAEVQAAQVAARPQRPSSDCTQPADLTARYVRLLASPLGWLVCLAWLGATVVGALSFGTVLAELRTEFLPLKGSTAEAAVSAYSAAFPHNKTADTLAVLWSADGAPLSLPAVRNVTAALAAFLQPYYASGKVFAAPVSVTSLADAGWNATAAQLLSADGSTTFVRVTSQGDSKASALFVGELRQALPGMLTPGVRGGLAGQAVMAEEGGHAIESDIVKSDAVTLPLSLCLLGCVVRSLRLVLLTVACLACAIMTSFACELHLARAVAVPTFVVSLMVATCIAISLDYSLFLLSFIRGRLHRAGSPAAGAAEMHTFVAAMLRRTGHTIYVSGATLSACFFALALFPVPLLRWPGVSTGITVCFAVLVNLTLLPALLLAFPRFFAGDALPTPPQLLRLADRLGHILALQLARITPAPPAESGKKAAHAHADAEEEEDAVGDEGGALWHALAMFTQRRRRGVAAALVLLLVVPFAPHLREWGVSQAWEGSTPKGSEALRLSRTLTQRFGGAVTAAPSLLVGVARNGSATVLEASHFAAAQAAVRGVLAARPDTLVQGLLYSSTTGPTQLASLSAALAAPCPPTLACALACPEVVCLAQQSARAAISPQRNAVLVKLQPRMDTFTEEGYSWALAVRAAVEQQDAADPLFAWHFVGDAGVNIADSVAYVYDFFPALMGATAAVVFLIIGIAFKSLVTPLRTIATIAIMLVAVYGAACAVYHLGLLDPAGSDLFTSELGGLMWLMPVLCFSISVGLGLDYDVFLMERIMHERREGWDDTSAIVRGVERSGPIISWAGAIMAVAFGGLFSASLPMLNQLAFFIVFGVLIDTFAVRTFVVPALMGCLGTANWWPFAASMPKATKTVPDVAALLAARGAVAPEPAAAVASV